MTDNKCKKFNRTTLVVLKNENNALNMYIMTTTLMAGLQLLLAFFVLKPAEFFFHHWDLILLQTCTYCLILTWFNSDQTLYVLKIGTIITMQTLLSIIAVLRTTNAHKMRNL